MWEREKSMMRQIFAAKKRFHGAFLAEQSEKYVSPGRGWYHIYTVQPDKRDEEQLKWLPMEEDETLVLLRLDIGAFRNRSIDAQTLAFVERILKCFAENRKDIILRILYDVDGRGMAHEPASIDMVCEHMRSLGKAVTKQASAILLVQGLFVGSWGEMHDSKFLDPEAIRKLWETWQEATEGAIPLAVRKPVYARMIGDTVGFYDDAILADETHMGTFGRNPRKEAQAAESWCASDEYAFIRERMDRMPIGGEAIGGTECGTKEILTQLKMLPVTYLNSIYHPDTMAYWKSMTAPDGGSLYSYIGNHMGYRLVVRDVKWKHRQLMITIENNGFARLYEDVAVELAAQDEQDRWQSRAVDADLRMIEPGTKHLICVENVEESFGKCGYRLYLKAIRKRDGREIRFANEGVDSPLLIGTIEER